MDATKLSRSLFLEDVCRGELRLIRWEGNADLGFGPSGGDSMVSDALRSYNVGITWREDSRQWRFWMSITD